MPVTPSRPFEPWLFAIARNLAIDHARRRLKRMTWEVLVESQPEVAAEAHGDVWHEIGQRFTEGNRYPMLAKAEPVL